MGNFSITQAEKGKRRDFLDKSSDPQIATTLRRMLSLRAPTQLMVGVGVSLGMCTTARSPTKRLFLIDLKVWDGKEVFWVLNC